MGATQGRLSREFGFGLFSFSINQIEILGHEANFFHMMVKLSKLLCSMSFL